MGGLPTDGLPLASWGYAGGTHPTGMFSCWSYVLSRFYKPGEFSKAMSLVHTFCICGGSCRGRWILWLRNLYRSTRGTRFPLLYLIAWKNIYNRICLKEHCNDTYLMIISSNKYKKFWRILVLFIGPLILLLRTSDNTCPDFQNWSGSPVLHVLPLPRDGSA